MTLRYLLTDDENASDKLGPLYLGEPLAVSAAAPEEEVFTSSGGQTDFSLSGFFDFDPSNSVKDIIVYKNVSRQHQSESGSLADGHYSKLTGNTFRFLNGGLKDGDKVIVRKEAVGTGVNLEQIGVDPQPAVSGSQELGTVARPWGSVFVVDKVTGSPFEIAVSGNAGSYTALKW